MKANFPKLAYRYRGSLVAIPLVIAVFSTWHEYENHTILWAVAGGIFIMGLALRIWAQQHIHFRLRTEKGLTITGPYTMVRNPIYIANTLICIAL